MTVKKNKISVLGSGATFREKIQFSGNLEVHGKLFSNVKLKKFTLAKGGFYEGNIHSTLSYIAGEFRGKINSNSIWLSSSAKMSGLVNYNSLQMDRGAAMNCRIVHNWDEDQNINLLKKDKTIDLNVREKNE